MEFTGRQELATTCEKNISELKQGFIKDSLNFYKTVEAQANYEQAEILFEEIFDCLLLRDFDKDAIRKRLQKLTKDERTYQNLLNFALLELVLKFNASAKETNHTSFFINAVSRLKSALNIQLRFENDTPMRQTSSNIVASLPSETLFYESPTTTFKRMKAANQRPELLNLYDGVNIRHYAEILEVGDTSVVFGVDVMQILAMKQEGNGFIVPNDYFPKHLRSDIIDFSIAGNTVTLANFTRIPNMSANLRKFQRVHPNRFTKVFLKSDEGELDGNLYDISDGGLSVLSQKVAPFHSGNIINACFELLIPHTNETRSLNLELNLVTELAYKGSIRYCLQIASAKDLDIVRSFTKERVAQTLEELNALINLYK